jgi:hypothetical protein
VVGFAVVRDGLLNKFAGVADCEEQKPDNVASDMTFLCIQL